MFNRFSNMVLALAVTAVLSVAVAAQDKVEKKVSFYLDGKVGTELVKKGTYTVAIPEAEQGTVEIKVGKKVVTAQFTKKQNTNEADADRMTYRENADGTRTVASITPRGQKFTLVLAETASSVAKQ
ncbi:MAG: hypothetical protein AAB316_20285 [Bacteroidota bacterium]